MSSISDYKMRASDSLDGIRGTLVIIYLAYTLIIAVISLIFLVPVAGYYIAAIIFLIVDGPFLVGFSVVALSVIRSGTAETNMLFEGFNNFGRAIIAFLTTNLLVLCWTLLLVVPGIIKSFAYSQTYFILADFDDLSVSEARRLSEEIMRGNKWRLFVLNLSFIGWMLLGIISLGIGFLWIMPYMDATRAAFYDELIQDFKKSGGADSKTNAA